MSLTQRPDASNVPLAALVYISRVTYLIGNAWIVAMMTSAKSIKLDPWISISFQSKKLVANKSAIFKCVLASLQYGLSVGPSVRRSIADCEEDATYGDRPCFFYDVEHIDVS